MWNFGVTKMEYDFKKCRLCPRECSADRTAGKGYCHMSDKLCVARVMLHRWEEPCLTGEYGAGAVFFSGCSLKCVYCQNYEISESDKGKKIDAKRLSEIFLELQEKKAACIDLVTPTHFTPQIISALEKVKDKLFIPVVYNCGGYEKAETLKYLDGLADVYLPDLKYMDSVLSGKYSSATDYFEYASEALKEMCRQTGKIVYDENNIMKRGVIIRHMILPSCRKDSLNILKWISEKLPRENFIISLMSQYYPCYKSGEFKEINRKLSTYEYNCVLDEAVKLGLEGFMQDRNSADKSYTPDFNTYEDDFI